MPQNKRTYLVSSFGPEIMQALLRGARERFVIGPLTYRKAVQFQQRINSLRRAMRESEHPQYGLVTRTKIAIVFGRAAGFEADPEVNVSSHNVRVPVDRDTPSKLIIEPHDREFGEVLVKSGLPAGVLKDDPLDSISPPDHDTPGDDYLTQVLKEKKDLGV